MDGSVVPDLRRRLPGRGAWLHFDLECLRNAERRRAFSRALKVQGALDVALLREHLEEVAAQEVGRGTASRPAGNKEAGRPVMSQP
ncbi:YlxR family protein [Lentzea sp. NPDC060358]|uniref:YlxR family protein n=1 Tax=Lentzea sp. NPDC060358 TaxID=3347103 RepID=UPI003653F4B2